MIFSVQRQFCLILFCIALCSATFVGPAYSQFTTILNIPPDPNIGDNESIGSNTQLNLSGGGVIGFSFDAGASDGTSTNVEVNISGGTVGRFDRVVPSFSANDGSTVNISGGVVGSFDGFSSSFSANDGSTVNISGGSVGDGFAAIGEVGITAFGGSIVNISGGTVVSGSSGLLIFGLVARSGSNVNLFGTEFVLDGIDLTASLTPTFPFTITDRNVTLSGLLADGSPFSFDLNSSSHPVTNQFDLAALLTVTLVHPGDFNGDGYVNGFDFLKWQRGKPNPFNAADLAAWEANYGMGSAIPKPGDFNGDGTVNGFDFLKWQRGESPYPVSAGDLVAWEANYPAGGAPLSSTAAAVPEPASLLLLATAIVALSVRSNRTGATVWLAQQ